MNYNEKINNLNELFLIHDKSKFIFPNINLISSNMNKKLEQIGINIKFKRYWIKYFLDEIFNLKDKLNDINMNEINEIIMSNISSVYELNKKKYLLDWISSDIYCSNYVDKIIEIGYRYDFFTYLELGMKLEIEEICKDVVKFFLDFFC